MKWLAQVPVESEISGLYLTGHWNGLPTGYSGIPTVVGSGRRTAEKLIASERKRPLNSGRDVFSHASDIKQTKH